MGMPEAKVIGKVASTLEEIKSILDDKTQNKLHNTLKGILSANISMANLLSELVDVTKKEQKVQVKNSLINFNNVGKILNKTNKVLFDIKDILVDMSKNNTNRDMSDIKKILSNISKKIDKKPSEIKLSATETKKVVDKMMKQMSKENDKMKKLFDMINIVSRLKDIKFTELLKLRPKINQIHKIYGKLLDTFHLFKDDKEVKAVNKFANDSIDIIKKLSKISLLSKSAKLGTKVIDEVFFGKAGLVTVFNKFKQHEKDIKKAKKVSNDLLFISGRVLLTALVMTGVALLGPTAILGGIITAGIVLTFGGVVWLMGKMDEKGYITKGNIAMIPLTAAMVLAGTGLLLMNKATKDLEWEQLGKAATAILGFGVLTVAAGFALPLILSGSVAMGVMGLSLVALGGGMGLFNVMVSDDAIEKVSYGIPKIFDAMMSIFGMEEGSDVSFGDGVLGIITGCLKCGGVMFASAAIAVSGIALGIAAAGLWVWNSFPKNAIDNVTYAIEKLDSALGLGLKDNRHSEGGIVGSLSGVGQDILGFGSSMLQFGKTFFGMGTILMASFTMGLVKQSLEKWKNFDPTNAMNNMETALTKFDKMLGLGLFEKAEEPYNNIEKGFWDRFKNGLNKVGDVISVGLDSSMSKSKLGVMLMATQVSQNLVKTLIDINKFIPDMDKSIKNLQSVFDTVTTYFFGNGGEGTNVMQKIAEARGDGEGYGALHSRLGVLMSCVDVISKMSNAVISMKDVKSPMKESINNIFTALDLITQKFFDKPDNGTSTSLEKVGKAINDNNNWLGFGGSGKINSQLEIIVGCVGVVSKVSDIIKTMSDQKNMSTTIESLTGYMDSMVDYFLQNKDFDDAEDNADDMEDIIDSFVNSVKKLSKISSVNSIEDITNKGVSSMRKIFGFIMGNTKFQVFDGEKNVYEKQDIKKIKELSKDLPDIFENLSDSLKEINKDFSKAFTNLNNITNSLSTMTFTNGATVNGIGIAISNLTDGLIKYSKQTNTGKIDKLNHFVKQVNALSKLNDTTMFKSVRTVIDKINTVQIDKANALTDAFKAFSKINSFSSFFTDFKKQVDLFTDACIRLVDAINGNTDALTTTDTTTTTNTTHVQSKDAKHQVYISNVNELAEMIAKRIGNKSSYFGGGFGDTVEVDLRINGESGDSWVIRKY